MDPIRILIADDHPRFRDGWRIMLRRETDMEIVGEAPTGAEAIRLAETCQPDVVLMDLHMPDVNGVEATRRILETSPHIRILVITMYEDDDSVFAALRAGARGYLLKGRQNRDPACDPGGDQWRGDLWTSDRTPPDALLCDTTATSAANTLPRAHRP